VKIYVASSWRNEHQPQVVSDLRAAGHEVYDFRNPAHQTAGFRWDAIDPRWQAWTSEEYARGLSHPVAKEGFARDMEALVQCDACVLVLPSGRSAHLEAGYAAGSGKLVVVYIPSGVAIEPELMYAMATSVETMMAGVVAAIG
jgi:hypothetical protein